MDLPKGWGAPGTAALVRDHLLEVGADSSYGAWLAVKEKLEGLDREYVPPSRDSIRVIFWALRKLGMIERVGEEPTRTRTWLAKVLYRVTPGREKAAEWENPILAARDPARFQATRGFRREEFLERTLPKLLEGRKRWLEGMKGDKGS